MIDKPAPGPNRSRSSIGARRSPETEAAIMEAARDVLADKGYSGFSVEEVARRACAGKPTIYRWWPTKADLLVAVYTREKTAAMRTPDTGSLAEDLIGYTRALWSFWRNTPSGQAFRALVAEAQGSAASLEALRQKFLPERRLEVGTMFARAVERGELDPADVEERIALYVGFNWLHALTDRLDDDPAAVERMAAILAAGARRAAR